MSLIGRWFGIDGERACEEGLAAIGRRDFSAAAQAFRRCEQLSRREATVRLARFHLAECHAQLALASWEKGNFGTAREEIETSLGYTNPTPERLLIAAQIARRVDDPNGAACHLECALERVPDHPHALALRALH